MMLSWFRLSLNELPRCCCRSGRACPYSGDVLWSHQLCRAVSWQQCCVSGLSRWASEHRCCHGSVGQCTCVHVLCVSVSDMCFKPVISQIVTLDSRPQRHCQKTNLLYTKHFLDDYSCVQFSHCCHIYVVSSNTFYLVSNLSVLFTYLYSACAL